MPDVASAAAGAALAGVIATALKDGRLVGPQRRRVIEETSDSATRRATDALEAALKQYEAYNARLRSDVSDLESRTDDLVVRLRAALDENEYLQKRIDRLVEKLASVGESPPPDPPRVVT